MDSARSIEEEEAERYRQERAHYLVSIVTDETEFIETDFDHDARAMLANAWGLDPTAVSTPPPPPCVARLSRPR